MAKSSCRYNGDTKCNRAWIHTWISALHWQLALSVNICNLVCSHKLSANGSKVWPTKTNTDKGTLKRTVQCYCHLWFLDKPFSLVTALTKSTEISIQMGNPFGFQCCFLVNQGRIVTKNRSISKAKINNCQLHRSLQSCVVCIALGGQNLKPQMHVCVFIPAHKYLTL